MGPWFSFTRGLCAGSAESGQVIRAIALTSSDVIMWRNCVPDGEFVAPDLSESLSSVLCFCQWKAKEGLLTPGNMARCLIYCVKLGSSWILFRSEFPWWCWQYPEPYWPLRLTFVLPPPVSLQQVMSAVLIVYSGPFSAWFQNVGRSL